MKISEIRESHSSHWSEPSSFTVEVSGTFNLDSLTDAVSVLGGFPVIAHITNSSRQGKFIPVNGMMELSDVLKRFPSVRVLKMGMPKIAGAAFTPHPETGRDDQALIESYAIDEDGQSAESFRPNRYVAALRDFSVLEIDEDSSGARLERDLIEALATQVLEIMAHFGGPQAVRWSLGDEGISILEIQPMGEFQGRGEIRGFTSLDFRDTGVSSPARSPMMYSLYESALKDAHRDYGASMSSRFLKNFRSGKDPWIGYYYGRPFWSGPEIFRNHPVSKYSGESAARHLRLTKTYPVDFTIQEGRWLGKTERFETTDDNEFFNDFLALIRFQKRTETDFFTTIFHCTRLLSDFRLLLDDISRATRETISFIDLVSGLQDLAHLEMQRGLARLCHIAGQHGFESPVWATAFEDFLDRHYYEGEDTLDVIAPRWDEAPQNVRRVVEAMIAGGHRPRDPESMARHQHALFLRESRKVEKLIGGSFWKRMKFGNTFRETLNLSRSYLAARETMRDISARGHYLVRRYVLEAGARLRAMGYLEHIKDAFMLQAGEIERIIWARPSKESVIETVTYRRRIYEGYRHFHGPRESVEAGEKTGSPVIFEDRNQDVLSLKGSGCSGGVTEGKIRIVKSPGELGDFQKNEILVTRSLDQSWAPFLGVVSGLVSEGGGPLSYAAVVGRELGVPAVFEIPGVTSQLKTGQNVLLDGNRGIVQVLY